MMGRYYSLNPESLKCNPVNLFNIDNFLEANLDAQLIHDEIKIDRELENVPEEEMEFLLNQTLFGEVQAPALAKGIKVETLWMLR